MRHVGYMKHTDRILLIKYEGKRKTRYRQEEILKLNVRKKGGLKWLRTGSSDSLL
jgi:hypothetical protein